MLSQNAVNGRMAIKRGAFLVLEGCDRSGKSTQSKNLVKFFEETGVPVKHMVFPARQSNIGQVINAYLTNKQNIPDECIHLLFAANRWEFKHEMEELLKAGTTLVVDRYSYSGVAYSVAKGFDYDWCMAPERGLLRPDGVFYLKSAVNCLIERGNFGNERYEKLDFQEKVANVFNKICENEGNYWHVINSAQTEHEVYNDIKEKALQIIKKAQNEVLRVL